MSTIADTRDASFGGRFAADRAPAHWLMARLGKRMLRPGGRETTRWLLAKLALGDSDDVVELAPGLGATAREILALRPKSYTAVERDAAAAAFVERSLKRAGFRASRIVLGDASRVPLPDGSASVVFGEAMLTMQPIETKRAIVSEARRLLRPGGRYAIHELAMSEELDPPLRERLHRELARSNHMGARIGTPGEWRRWLEEAGFEIEESTTAPMRLLELDRLVRDEGVLATARFALNAVRVPGAWQRLRSIRAAFRSHRRELFAVALVARRRWDS